MLTHLLNSSSPEKERYNKSQIRGRNTIERLFGQIKQKFRWALRGMFIKLDTVEIAQYTIQKIKYMYIIIGTGYDKVQ